MARVGNTVRMLGWGAAMTAGLLFAGCGKPPAGEPLDVVMTIGEPGDQPGQFGYPRATCTDGKTVWVIDKLARVQRFDRTGKVLGVWRMPKYDKGKPAGVSAWVPPGTHDAGPILLIADTHEQRVRMYQTDWTSAGASSDKARVPVEQVEPELLASFGSYGEGPGEFIYVTDVAVLPTADGQAIERLYVSEYGGNDRVNIFAVTPPLRPGMKADEFAITHVGAFGRFGEGWGEQVEFQRPQAVMIDVDRRMLVISDACNHRVGTFTLEGKLIDWFGSREGVGNGPGEFSYPYGIALLGDGTAMVSEFGNNRVQRIDLASGACLGIFGQAGRSKGQLATPWAITALDDKVYVIDSGNSRVQVIEKPRGTRVLRDLASSDAARAPHGATTGGAQ
jgi:hypothetical protein